MSSTSSRARGTASAGKRRGLTWWSGNSASSRPGCRRKRGNAMHAMLRWAAVGALVVGLGPRALAQDESPPYRPLPIPVPQGAKVHMELDTHDEDLLGVLKSLLRGFNPAGMAAMMRMPQAMPGMPGAPGTMPGGPEAGAGFP